MRRLRVIGVVMAMVFAGVIAVGAPSLSGSVWPITAEGKNICTATSIHEKEHRWLTAAHCVDARYPLPSIRGEQVAIVVRDVPRDVAVVKTPTASAPALHLAKRAPKLEDRVRMIGYPLGLRFQVTTLGTVAALSGLLDEGDTVPYTMFQLVGAPGNSGSAITNDRGDVVSVLQIGWGMDRTTFGSMVGGAPYETLESYWQYFER